VPAGTTDTARNFADVVVYRELTAARDLQLKVLFEPPSRTPAWPTPRTSVLPEIFRHPRVCSRRRRRRCPSAAADLEISSRKARERWTRI